MSAQGNSPGIREKQTNSTPMGWSYEEEEDVFLIPGSSRWDSAYGCIFTQGDTSFCPGLTWDQPFGLVCVSTQGSTLSRKVWWVKQVVVEIVDSEICYSSSKITTKPHFAAISFESHRHHRL